MKIIVKNGSDFVWTRENVKKATIYNQDNEGEENTRVVIDGFVEDVPNGYFIQSFGIGDFDRICLEEK